VAVNFSLTISNGIKLSSKKNEDVLADSVVAASVKFFNQVEPIIVYPTMEEAFASKFIPRYVYLETSTVIFKDEDNEVSSIDKWFEDAALLQDCLILKWVENSQVVTVYTVNVYEEPYGFCGELQKLIYLDTWLQKDNHGSFLRNNSLRINKIPKSLRCCRLYNNDYVVPYAYTTYSQKGIIYFEGIVNRLLHHINEVMTDTRNCEKVGIIQVSLGFYNYYTQESLFPPQKLTYIVPMARWHHRWSWFTLVFNPSVWMIFVCCLAFAATMIKLIAGRGQVAETTSYNSISNCLMNMWAAILGVGVYAIPRSSRVRILFFSWVTFSLVVSTIFQSFFTSYFMLQIQDHQIQTKEELESEGYTFVFDGSYSYLSYRNNRSVFIEDNIGGIQYMMNTPKTALFNTKEMFSHYASHYCKRGESPGYYYELPSFEESRTLRIKMLNGLLLQNKLDQLVTRLKTTGLTQKLYNDFFQPWRQEIVKSSLQPPKLDYEPMTCVHLQSCYFILIFALTLSGIVFILELIIHRVSVVSLKRVLYFMLQIQDHQIQTKEEIEAEGYTIVFETGLSYLRHRTNRSVFFDDFVSAFQYMINTPKTVAFTTKQMFTFYAMRFCKPGEFPGYFYELPSFERLMTIGMFLYWHPLLQKKLDEVLTRLISTGITQKVYNDFFNPGRQDIVTSSLKPPELDYQPLTLVHLQSCFLILMYGLILSVIVFILELIIHIVSVVSLKRVLSRILNVIVALLYRIYRFMFKCLKFKNKFFSK
ncbi:hypothetical protein C0J52_27901, partial [Blattella germanica]